MPLEHKTEEATDQMSCFSFGEPEQVLKGNDLLDNLGTFLDADGEYYTPPVALDGLSKMKVANSHHGSCIVFRRNMVTNSYNAKSFFSLKDFRNAALDYLTFGNAYLQVIRNAFGKPLKLVHVPALNMRKRKDGRFCMLISAEFGFQKKINFQQGEILHVKEYDTRQSVYGLPDWLGGLQSMLLNEDATLFRRRYYNNGAHMGFILYTNDEKMSPAVEKRIKEQVKKGKGAGNFKSMFLNIPGGKEKAVQIIPIGDISQKDEFQRIKTISADDVIVAHRVPPALVSVKLETTGVQADPEKVEKVYMRTEVRSMAQPWLELNEELPKSMQLSFNYKIEESE